LTGIRQIVAGILGLDISAITVVSADSGGARGGGAWASRGLALAGEAACYAAEALRDNLLEVAAGLLQTTPGLLKLEAGTIKGSGEESLELTELAQMGWFKPHELPDGATDLFAVSRSYTLEGRPHLMTNGVQASVVDVDAETGAITLLGHWVVEDCGNIINPALVDGQIMGGAGQGIGGALGEECRYDASGQLLSASFLDYAMARADVVPPMHVHHVMTPQVGTKLGAKGVGEAGNIGAPAAIWSAVNDALAPLGASINSQPITSEVVFRALKTAAAG
jgi:carbon-monoxide dehydrogenase large subunit